MAAITRNPSSASKESFDLVVVGGGIYGACLLLEASRRGMRSLLVERGDFGGGTSFNSLRIVHGGLRYLQSFDWQRFRESVGERKWLLKTFPELVNPMGCLMPLYGAGLRRPTFLRLALYVNDAYSGKRNQGLPLTQQIPAGILVAPKETRRIFPLVDTAGLEGGAVWYDGFVSDAPRLIIEILRWACSHGATALNYLQADQLLKTAGGKTAGIIALDREANRYHEYRANVVVNACGPWCRSLAERFDRDHPALFRSSLAWNVLFRRPALSDYALAVTPKRRGARTYFLVPWRGELLAGTGHAAWHGCPENPYPTAQQLQHFIDDLNHAIPNLGLVKEEIAHVFAGLLPAKKQGKENLAVREVIMDHSCCGGPEGLFSVSGVKLTTARLVAEKTIDLVLSKGIGDTSRTSPFDTSVSGAASRKCSNGNGMKGLDEAGGETLKNMLEPCIREESVQHLEDLYFRRTDLWLNPGKTLPIADAICALFPWDEARRQKEKEQLIKKVAFSYNSLAEQSR